MNGSLTTTARHIEQASALLDVINETELQTVLGRLVRNTARQTGRAISDHDERAVTAVVRRAAVETLPTLAAMSGRSVDPARQETPVATAARVYGVELEGLSAEDRDYEIARQLVRFAEAAVRAAAVERSTHAEGDSARHAVERAAREFAPGLFSRRAQRPRDH